MVDFFDSKECFPGVDIAGGVCYFLWNREKQDDLCNIVNHFNGKVSSEKRQLNRYKILIRNNFAVDTVEKVSHRTACFMNSIVRPVSLFGLNTNFDSKQYGAIIVKHSNGFGKCELTDIKAGFDIINKYKVIISAAAYDHAGQPDKDGKRRINLDRMSFCDARYIITVGMITNVKPAIVYGSFH